MEKRFLQAGIDIRCNIPNVILQSCVTGLQRFFHLIDGIKHSGVVLTQLFTDIRGGEVGQLSDQVDSHLTGFCSSLVLQCATEHRLVYGIELAVLIDDQACGGQCVALALKHIIDGPGDIGKIQGHIIQIPVCHDFLYSTFILPDIVGDVDGNIVAHIVAQLQA